MISQCISYYHYFSEMVHLFLFKIGPFFDSHLVSAPGLSGEGGKPWDYAAGTIIAMEAGAKFCNLQGAVVGSTP